jgi:L-alanine-DL-glutamate epimerase-like enolase superfamily enzyme
MQVTRVETLWPSSIEPASFFFVQVHTDEGYVGLGQAPDPQRTIPAVEEWSRRFLLGQDPLAIARFWDRAFTAARAHGYAGAELRALSALDIALWDIAGQVAGQPIYQLLGGKVRDRIRVYNTCSHYRDYNDRLPVRQDPLRLVEELLAEGITAFKFSMFDALADATLGTYLAHDDLVRAVEPIRRVHEAYGTGIEIGIEGHARWNLPMATRIAQYLERFHIMWLEDLLPPDNPAQLGQLRARTRLLLGGSELLFTRWHFLPLLQAGGTDIVIADITWCGGISELARLAALAATFDLPLAPHDHTGPVGLFATAHVMAQAPNGLVMETTRAFYRTYYPDLVDPAPVIRDGHLALPEGPGLGTRLRPAVWQRPDLVVHVVAPA